MNVPASLLDKDLAHAHRLRNILHSVVLVAGIGGITAFGAYLLWGSGGVVGTFIAIMALILFGPRASTEMVMRLFRAEPLDPRRGAALHEIIAELARRANLPAAPKVYIVPSRILNAFAVGTPDKSSLAVSSGLLETLTDRELIGVLAHEISHIRNNDIWIMGLADMLSRLTQLMSTMGMLFLFYNAVAQALGGALALPWSVALMLYLMPAASSLLQLALSRAREYDADLEAAQITGDPDGLASALARLEQHQGRMWEDMLPSGRRIAIPSVLRSHPASEDRIRRLAELKLNPLEQPLPPRSPSERTITLVLEPFPVHRGRAFPGVRL